MIAEFWIYSGDDARALSVTGFWEFSDPGLSDVNAHDLAFWKRGEYMPLTKRKTIWWCAYTELEVSPTGALITAKSWCKKYPLLQEENTFTPARQIGAKDIFSRPISTGKLRVVEYFVNPPWEGYKQDLSHSVTVTASECDDTRSSASSYWAVATCKCTVMCWVKIGFPRCDMW